MELYGHAPYTVGGIEKPEVVLVGFAKTRLLAPGESETVTIDFDPYYLASYDSFGGGIRVVPAIRYPEDRDALWEGLVNGDIDMVGTDHAPHSYEEKFEKSWWDTLPGTIGVQTSLPLILDRCNKGEISLGRVVEVMSETPAKVWGLYPRKGCLQVGADADITIVDMNLEWTVTHEEMYSKTKYTPFNGFQLKGKPVMTIVMGQIAMEDGKIVGKPGVPVMVNPKQDWE